MNEAARSPARTHAGRAPTRLQLSECVAVVTGAGSGIGQASALEFAARGTSIVCVDRDEANARATAARITAQGGRAWATFADVRETSDLERVYRATLEHFGRVDIVMNNAGVLRVGAAFDVPLDTWREVVDVNFWGVVHGCRIFGQHFKERGRGHIVNTSSAAGLSGLPYSASYAASKFAVVGLSESLRWELAQFGVGVTVVCPGVVRTGIARGSGAEQTARLVERFGLPVEPLARRIVRAVEKDRARVIYGVEPRVWSALRWLSEDLHEAAGKAFARVRHDRQLY